MGTALRFWPATLLPLALGQIGCSTPAVNPSFSVSRDEAANDLRRIADDPRPLDRPLVIVTGFLDPGIAALSLRMRFDSLTHDQRMIAVTLGECLSISSCRQKVIDAVDHAFPTTDLRGTTEVDVIGYSLGGLIARYAAHSDGGESTRRLNIARLFTISSPHRGAADADRLPLLHPMQKDLRSGSAMVADLNASGASYPLFAYVRVGDRSVGCENAAPPGKTAWWVATPAMSDPHNGAFSDERILADIARRLRGEEPFATEPPAPLPEGP